MHAAIRHAVWIACLLATPAMGVLAADPPPPSATTLEAACTHAKIDTEVKTAFLPKMKEGAVEVRKSLCVEGATREQILAAFALFVDRLVEDKWFSPYGGFQGATDPLAGVQRALRTDGAPIPTIAVVTPPAGGDDVLEVAGSVFQPADVEQCNAKTDGRGCGPIFDEFSAYYTYAHNSFSSRGAQAFARSVAGLSKQWSDYLDSSRSMTPLELLINSALYKRDETRQFSPPPAVQYIVLHPSLIIENVSAAVGGEQLKEALMIEIGGVNWWQQDRWYLPTGGSIVAVYSDRPDIDEFGYGLALNFRSVYTIGYTRHGSKDGAFISFDLLKLVQDKKKILESYD